MNGILRVTDSNVTSTEDTPTGVWVLGDANALDWVAHVIYPGTHQGKLDALHEASKRGYGDVRFVEFGKEGQMI